MCVLQLYLNMSSWLAAVVNWHTPPEVRAQAVLRYNSGQVVEAQAGDEFPHKDSDYHATLGYKPLAPPPVDRYVSLSFFLSWVLWCALSHR